jgi:uncharacterized protein (DUF305 family)
MRKSLVAAMSTPKSNWLAAVELGLVSSTFSTIVSYLFAARIGRDAAVDWMTVAAIPARDWAISTEPSWSSILIGIAFHQWADFSWALVFFGVLGRWTAGLRPLTIFLLAMPWAVFTSATEWLLLVPLLPFWQPLFTLQQPYWIGLLVHLSSAAMYPVFSWLRYPLGRAPNTTDVVTAKAWGTAALATIAVLTGLAIFASLDRELPWMGADQQSDQNYMRHMTTHHAQGLELANLAVSRARDPHLGSLSMLMVASQTGEVRIFERWWRSWFDASMPLCSASERAAMPGLLSDGQMQQIKSAAPDQFDTLFIHLMSIHHAGAVKMAIKPGVGRAILGSALWRTRSVTDSRARSTSCTVPPGLMRSTPHSGI